MLECSICRRQFDGRFKIMVPPSNEAFDSIECARQAAMLSGLDAAALTPVVLPTLETAPFETMVMPVGSTPRKGMAALAAILLVPSQAALAGGVGLAAAGTAASIYLTTRPPTQPAHSISVTAAAPAPALPFSQRPRASEKPAVRAPLRLTIRRPPDAAARPLVVAHAAKHAKAQNLVSTRSSTHSSSVSTSGSTQLISGPVPVTRPAPISAPTPVAKPKPTSTPVPSSSPAPKPKKPKPAPKPRPRPTVTVPTGPAAATGPASKPTDPATSAATRQLASATTTPPKPKPKPKPPPVTQPTGTPPPQGGDSGGGSSSSSSDVPCDDDSQPGNGLGVDNHEHSGPPGQSGDHGDHGSHGDHDGNGNHGDDSHGDHGDHGDHGGGGHGKGH